MSDRPRRRPGAEQRGVHRLKRFSRVAAGILLLASAFSHGYLAHRNQVFPYRLVRIVGTRVTEMLTPTTRKQEGLWFERPGQGPAAGAKAERLAALPYLQGYEAPAGRDVRVLNADRMAPGHNFVVSGHGPEAFLIDQEGAGLHRWQYSFRRAWPNRSDETEGWNRGHDSFWRHAELLKNGDVLAIFEGMGLIRVSKDSELIWAYGQPSHHDLDVTAAGLIYVLTRRQRTIPTISPDPVLEDFVTVLTPEGEEIRAVSLYEALRRSKYSSLIDRIEWFDTSHTNALAILDGSLASVSPAYQKGNVLLSMRNLDLVAILDVEAGEIVWALTGLWKAQHDPHLLANGRLLLFDNLGGGGGSSRVIELDPLTQRISWQFAGTPGEPLFSEDNGRVARLSNGNTLIVESNRGRALEITKDEELVWEFENPNRAGEDGELVAAVFSVVRVPKSWTEALLNLP